MVDQINESKDSKESLRSLEKKQDTLRYPLPIIDMSPKKGSFQKEAGFVFQPVIFEVFEILVFREYIHIDSYYILLGGGFEYLLFSSLFGEDSHFD